MCEKCGCGGHPQDPVHLILQVKGMHCSHCSDQINQTLNALPDITAKADHESGEVSVTVGPHGDLQTVKEKIEELGFEL
ncbi:MAG: heavy-metal-associated domain-containing protein [Firmicutes bacterium]|nr:heavy-metal-associated domain-containing protein [Bacillota bacterium]